MKPFDVLADTWSLCLAHYHFIYRPRTGQDGVVEVL